MRNIDKESANAIEEFILSLLATNVDARVFEIVTYAILKYYYDEQMVYLGFEIDHITKENLKLYKTGRTNANDGGIDFVMRPLGRFFQVTETLDVRKYFLDIDKIEHYPITFVIKSEKSIDYLKRQLEDKAKKQYAVAAIVRQYLNCIEEIINIPALEERFRETVKNNRIREVLEEIIKQSKVEFNHRGSDEDG
ncbi:MAG: hypothetical protein HQK56_13215 [Deltaproteobacteria bacterium]|nr:hypothetical protein [Deltaproteobacteria bacterium]